MNLRPAAGARRSMVAWAVLGLVIVLYYFRFAEYDWGMMPTYSPVGDCLMRGERLAPCAHSFPYPPLFALLMVPLTFLPMWARNVIWYGVLVSATYACLRICEALVVRAFQVRREELFWLRLFSVALSLKFVLSVFENQAYDTLVFFFILVGLYGLSQNRTFGAATGLAAATALKPTPALMLLYALFLRKWKVFALGVGTWLALSILPDLLFTPNQPGPGFLRTWIVDVAIGGLLGTSPADYYPLLKEVGLLNQSLKGLVFNIAYGRLDADFATHARTILYVVYFVYGLAALAVLLLSAKVEGALLWGASVILISMLLLSPVSSKSHFVVLLLPHTAIVAYLIRHREAWRTVLPLLCASFALNTLTSRLFMGRELSKQMLASGCVTLGTLLLLAVVAVIVLRSRKAAKSMSGEMRRTG
ncbi:MAG: DUF2029 domain-containing protein [Betaproteobacteria bacterium]|nr:DUF2029 domain-containing protein [Betaproteobacteria bacterium]MDH5221789.1 DUF2029 domain-containing protein [Betaproteobacteria bacterium]MDH5351484.1 DUF2029 domain-containing protein [Betaproteobacteria bacterium]